MYLLYLDESGHSNLNNPRTREQSDFFLLGGIIVKERDFLECDKKFRDFKQKIFPGVVSKIPVHSVELNNIDIARKNTYKGILTDEEGKEALTKCYEFLAKCPVEAISVVIDNNELKQKYTNPHNPYVLAYEFILEKFQKIIKKRKEDENMIGLVNIAECSTKLSTNLKHIHELIMQHGTQYVKDYDNMLNFLNIEPMEKSSYYEIADLVCYAFQRSYYQWLCKNLNKKYREYNYLKIIQPICTSYIGSYRIGNANLKIFPYKRRFKNNKSK